MILLDHNVPQHEVQRLRRWGIHVQQVGADIGRPEWDDQQEILRFLHRSKQLTFFTRDVGFLRRRLCHRNYCIVVAVCTVLETAALIHRFLRHSGFRTKAQRMGRVVKITPATIAWWQSGLGYRQQADWEA